MSFSFQFGFHWRKKVGKVLPILLGFAVTVIITAGNSFGQAFTESFDTVANDTATPVPGWTAVNHSTAATTRTWFQCNSAVIAPQSGGCISTNFNSIATSPGVGTISNWLISPSRTFSNGDKISFYTRTVEDQQFPDRLQVRLSLAGTSTNVGTGPTEVGDFTTVLLDINPNYDLTTYPDVMTQFTITLSGIATPTAGRIAFRYFVENGGPGSAAFNSDTIGIDTFVYTPANSTAPVQHVLDFDGDGKSDFATVRVTNLRNGTPVAGQTTWFIGNASGNGGQQSDFGTSFDFFLSGDYDGDKKSDITVWRPGQFAVFYILNSSNNTVRTEQFGTTNDDISVAADYDGDGKTDLAVYRANPTVNAPSYWIYRTTQGGPDFFVQWGAYQGVDAQQNPKGDFPLAGDFDGDGKSDFVVYRNDGQVQGLLLRRFSNGTTDTARVGFASDTVLPGDYDGDGKMDVGFARGDAASGQIDWYYKPSSAPAESYRYLGRWGSASFDFPVVGDYDGDGKSDMAVWRGVAEAPFTQNRFYVNQSSSGFRQFPMGKTGDFPVGFFPTH